MIIFYDLETNGTLYEDRPLNQQPHIVQAAAILVDSSGQMIDSLDQIVKPYRWKIPKSASSIHGISHEFAKENGLPEEKVFAALKKLMQKAEMRVAHNEIFDRKILDAASQRFDNGELKKLLDEMPSFCTMEKSINICKIPPTERMKKAGRNHYKSPRLSEVYRHFFGEDIKDVHNAMADVIACRKVYDELNKPKKSLWSRLLRR